MDGNLFLYSNAAASSGNLSLNTTVGMNQMTDWSSGFLSSLAGGSIVEPVAPWWQLWVAPGETFIFEYEISVSGTLFVDSGGPGHAGSSADLLYTYHVGDSHGAGTWSKHSSGQESKSGTWSGIVRNSFTVQMNGTFDLELRATAAAGGSKFYNPMSNVTLTGIADFSHTLTWLGITGVQAFDELGNEVPLPQDFSLPLIGQESGFDYWHSAAGEPSEVPEPATVFLFGAVWGVVGLSRKSAARRKDS